MDALARLIQAFTHLYETLGPWGAIAFLVVIAGAPLAITIYRTRELRAAYERVVEAKEETIQRIGEDNKFLRRSLMLERGMTAEDLKVLGEVGGATTPVLPLATKKKTALLAGKKKKKGGEK